MADKNSVVWGVKQLFIRPGDGNEYQIQAAQESQITAKATIAKLMGDDSLVALDTQPKSKDLAISFKNGQISQKVETLLLGGTNVSNAAASLTSPKQESVGTTVMNTLISSLINGQSANLISDTWTFLATGPNQYQVIQSSTGLTVYSAACSLYPVTNVIPGVSFTMPGPITLGDIASITTVASTDTVEIATQAKNDFASKVGVRAITEAPSVTKGETAGQFEWLFPVCQSEGIEWPLKTKEYCIISGSFMPIYDPNVGYIVAIRKYSRQY